MKENEHAVLESEFGGLVRSVWVMGSFDVPEKQPLVVNSVLVFGWDGDCAEARSFVYDDFVKDWIVEGGFVLGRVGVFFG